MCEYKTTPQVSSPSVVLYDPGNTQLHHVLLDFELEKKKGKKMLDHVSSFYLYIAETGRRPGRIQLYLDTHKKQDGTYVNEAAKEICEKIELALSQSMVDESEVLPNDAVGKVLGKEHSGRVRCLGLGAVPSKVFKHTRPRFCGMNASSSDASCLNHCQENYNKLLNAHNQSQENYNKLLNAHTQSQENYKEIVNSNKQMMNAFKAYMIMKERTIPEQFAGFFTSPPTTPRDAASGSLSPMGARRSSDGSNPSDNN
ncbi:uncharacterized protein LOC107814136 isoform X1 [Nicotiana tabacum]|uniref:Uncharacterized protein isoform X1 n=2 Tax=Nicotiana tabacum TaxID=4097 RepID=A0A1S4C1D9_TOBAC|nr:PREDICTED: uncharacterized protein LOC107814136 isoform X1 [Nicotiana tabacum]XP_016494962.1 PREDICTED: uncharacterized protein LOC107814136 isoform X1 [Nicotiana tabacum]